MRSKILLAAACLAAPLALAGDRLDIKTGLWEITSTSSFKGLPPLPKEVLDNLTAEQRAQMQALSQAAQGQTETDRDCVTEKDLEFPFDSQDTKECQQTVVRTTRTTQEVRFVCTGEHQGAGVLKITTPTPNTMSGTLDMKFGEGPDAMVVESELKGRWLGPQCSDEDEDDDSDEWMDEEDGEE